MHLVSDDKCAVQAADKQSTSCRMEAGCKGGGFTACATFSVCAALSTGQFSGFCCDTRLNIATRRRITDGCASAEPAVLDRRMVRDTA